MPVADVSLPTVLLLSLFLQGLENSCQQIPHDLVPVALEPPQKTVECEVVFWYPIAKGDPDFKVVDRATPSRLDFVLEGCSPSFLPLSNAIT